MADHVFARSRQKFKNLAGRRFTRLLVLGPMRRASGELTWLCRCDCGAEVLRDGKGLEKGESRSCGCLGRRHGHATRKGTSGEYVTWQNMIRRCFSPGTRAHERYSKLGMEPEWVRSFQSFLDHVGPRPSPAHQIERFDNERGYFRGNVGWATRREQMSNTRINRWVEHEGRRMTIAQWSRELGIRYSRVRYGIAHGWTIATILARRRPD